MKMAYISESTRSIAKVKSTPGSKVESRGHREGRAHRSGGSHRKRKSDRAVERDEVVHVYRSRADPRGSAQDGDRRRSMVARSPETPEMISSATVKRATSVRKHSTPEVRRSPPEAPTISIRNDRRETAVTGGGGETTLRRSQSARYPLSRQLDGLSRTRTLSSSTRSPLLVQTRPSPGRSNTTYRARSSPLRPDENPVPSVVPTVAKPHYPGSPGRDRRRTSGLLSALFGAPPAPRPPEKRVDCLTCMSDDVPVSRSAKLACGHVMCHDCLKRIFVLSVSDPQHMPPRCCTRDHIPLKHVERLFNDKFKMQWNRKYQEYTTKNRIYCPTRGCGEWIKPASIHVDETGGGRKYGKCGRCKTKVCCMCNGKWHGRKDCPKDEESNAFVEIAKKEGWQRCHNCSAMVELKEGCNHMTCRCTAEFCMICGAKWKTCNCPWFNYEQVENDRLNHFNVVYQRVEAEVPHYERRGYQEELERRRQQEQQDELIARRLQALNLDLDRDAYLGGHDGMVDNGVAQNNYLNNNHNYGGGGQEQGIAQGHPYTRTGMVNEDTGAERESETAGGRIEISELRRRASRAARRRVVAAEEPIVEGPESHIRQPPQASWAEAPVLHPPPAPRQPYTGYASGHPVQPAPHPFPGRLWGGTSRSNAAPHPHPGRLWGATSRSKRPAPDPRRLSTLAGLTRSHGQGGRVGAWLQHVEDGLPSEELRNEDIAVM